MSKIQPVSLDTQISHLHLDRYPADINMGCCTTVSQYSCSPTHNKIQLSLTLPEPRSDPKGYHFALVHPCTLIVKDVVALYFVLTSKGWRRDMEMTGKVSKIQPVSLKVHRSHIYILIDIQLNLRAFYSARL